MAEQVSLSVALLQISVSLLVFIPSATYTIYQLFRKDRFVRRSRWAAVAFLTASLTFAMIVFILNDIQHLYPRCTHYDVVPTEECLVDRYDDTGASFIVPREQAATLMRSDLFVDIARCALIPSVFGIAVLLVIVQVAKFNLSRQKSSTSEP